MNHQSALCSPWRLVRFFPLYLLLFRNLFVADEDEVLSYAMPVSDADGDQMRIFVTVNPTQGSVVAGGFGDYVVQYTPNANYNGDDGFSYVVSDGVYNSTVCAVAIKVKPVNDPPNVTPDCSPGVSTKQDVPVKGTLVAVDPDGDCSDTDIQPNTVINLVGVARDFESSHPDFQGKIATDKNIVTPTLDPVTRKPVYGDHPQGTKTTTNKAMFDQWWTTTEGVNTEHLVTVPLSNANSNDPEVFSFCDLAFFPLDYLGKTPGQKHNYFFSLELHMEFTYTGKDQEFQFKGDDDVWVYVNGKLVVDLGGVHSAQDGSFNMKDEAAKLGLQVGKNYRMDMFFVERHTSKSTFCLDRVFPVQSCALNIMIV